MLIVVQPLSAGVVLTARAVAAGRRCLVPTQFPELLPPEVHASAQVVDWHPDGGVPALLDLVAAAGGEPEGVVAGFEYAVPHAAGLARALGLPGLGADAAVAVRQKDVMRARCRERGIAVPGSATVEPGTAGGPPFAFPVVVKPVDCGGSLMVSLARDADGYASACAEVHAAADVKFHDDPRRVALVEEYVTGPEFSVEGWVDPAGVHLASITTKFVSSPPRFYEMGHVATLPGQSPYGEVLGAFTARVVEAFDIGVGPFHVEARIRPDGQPVLIEVGARLAGDSIPELIEAGPGVDLWLAAVDAACGVVHPPSSAAPRSAGLAFVTARHPGVFTGTLSGMEPFRQAEEFDGIVWEAEPGTVLEPDDIFSNRVAQVRFRGDRESVEKLVGAVLDDVQVDVRDKEGSGA